MRKYNSVWGKVLAVAALVGSSVVAVSRTVWRKALGVAALVGSAAVAAGRSVWRKALGVAGLLRSPAVAAGHSVWRRALGVASLLGLPTLAFGQTNTPAGVATTITTAVGAAYDTAIGIGVGVMAIGAVIYFVRKGLKARM